MQNLNAYSGLTTKICAMRSRFLTDDDMRELVGLADVPSVISWLRQKPAYQVLLADVNEREMHRGQLEPLLRESVFLDFNKIYRFANSKQRDFLREYFRRYEVRFLKECMAHILDPLHKHLDLSSFQRFFSLHSKLPFDALLQAETMEELVELLSSTPYYTPLHRIHDSEKNTLFDYESALDTYVFVMLWKARSKMAGRNEIEELTRILGTKFELLNIQWIFRCKRYYHMTEAEIMAFLIPVSIHLKRDQLSSMAAAPDVESLLALIDESYYARQARDFERESLEASYSRLLKDLLKRESRQSPYSVATIYSYLYHKEHEIDRLIIALECVRYRLPADLAMEHIARR